MLHVDRGIKPILTISRTNLPIIPNIIGVKFLKKYLKKINKIRFSKGGVRRGKGAGIIKFFSIVLKACRNKKLKFWNQKNLIF